MQSQCNSCKTLKKISLFYREVTFPRFRAKLITSLKTDLCQDINLRNIYLMLFSFWLMYKYLNRVITFRKWIGDQPAMKQMIGPQFWGIFSSLRYIKIITKYHKNDIVISAIIIITLTLSSNSKETILDSCQSNICVIKSNVQSLSHSTKKYLAFWIYIFFVYYVSPGNEPIQKFLKNL